MVSEVWWFFLSEAQDKTRYSGNQASSIFTVRNEVGKGFSPLPSLCTENLAWKFTIHYLSCCVVGTVPMVLSITTSQLQPSKGDERSTPPPPCLMTPISSSVVLSDGGKKKLLISHNNKTQHFPVLFSLFPLSSLLLLHRRSSLPILPVYKGCRGG